MDPEGRVHRGPDFGLIDVDMDDMAGWAAQVDQHAIDAWMDGGAHPGHVDATEIVARLEQLAADASRAAAWLRSQQ